MHDLLGLDRQAQHLAQQMQQEMEIATSLAPEHSAAKQNDQLQQLMGNYGDKVAEQQAQRPEEIGYATYQGNRMGDDLGMDERQCRIPR